MSSDSYAAVIFADIRGFTTWSEATEVLISLPQFLEGFFDIR